MMAFALIIFLGMLGPVLLGRHDSLARNLILVGTLLIGLVAFGLGRTRFYKWGSILLVFGIASTGFALVLTGLANDPSNALNTTLPLVLVMGSAILSLRGQLFLTLFCGFGPMILPLSSSWVTFESGMIRDGGIFLVLGLLLIGITVFRNRLEKTRLDEISVSNQALQTIQATLEQQVTERSRAAETARFQAETARSEAEAARQDLEAQMWVVAGQAALAEKMRGEQSIPQLADNIIVQLSRYLGAQAGALYLLEENLLHLRGSYAFTPRADFHGEFRLGEGWVGQAAVDQRALLVDCPASAAVISTALVELLPRQVLAVPFEEGGRVVGVIELAALTEFTAAQMHFLERVAENIGVAFRTAQARQRLAEVLLETQQQTEELQAQEEELRAANEELQAQAEHLSSIRSTERGKP
jgi:hypothetical protein